MQVCLCFLDQIQLLTNNKNYVVKGLATRLASTRPSPATEMLRHQKMNAIISASNEKYSSSVINRCYGGFGLSNFAMDLYRKRFMEKFSKVFKDSDQYISRDDSILVDIVKEFPERVSCRHSKLLLLHYPSKYDGFFRFWEDDGDEYGKINVEAYKLHNIKVIALSTLNADEKVQRINTVLDDLCEDARVLDEDDLPLMPLEVPLGTTWRIRS